MTSHCWVAFGCGLWSLNSVSGICVVAFQCLVPWDLQVQDLSLFHLQGQLSSNLYPLLPKIALNRGSEPFPFMFFPSYPFCSQHRRELIWFRELAKFPDCPHFLLFLFPFYGVTTDIILLSSRGDDSVGTALWANIWIALLHRWITLEAWK